MTLTWVIDILLEKEIEFEKHLLHTLLLGLGILCKVCLLFQKNYSGDLFFDVLIIAFFYIYVFTGQTHGEVSQGATFRIGSALAQTQAPGDFGVK